MDDLPLAGARPGHEAGARRQPDPGPGGAQLAYAREQVAVAQGAELPQVDLQAGYDRQEVNVNISGVVRPPVPVNVYMISPTVSYPLDIFGGLKRTVESARASVDLRPVPARRRLSCTDRQHRDAVDRDRPPDAPRRRRSSASSPTTKRTCGWSRPRRKAGTATEVDVTTAQSQLANDRTLLPPLRQRLSVARHALTVYAGKGAGRVRRARLRPARTSPAPMRSR